MSHSAYYIDLLKYKINNDFFALKYPDNLERHYTDKFSICLHPSYTK